MNRKIFRTIANIVPVLYIVGEVVPGKRRIRKAAEDSQTVAPVMSGNIISITLILGQCLVAYYYKSDLPTSDG